ncbi:MAG: HlyD family efflux transporter periplasmic adaptor subunit [Clostridia bacterium]|nr:HlyD family efflux transporter periplasmic adaptor subunit [Clostridia bacterium]
MALKKGIKVALIIAVLIYAIWNLVSFLVGQKTSEMVRYGTLENTFSGTAYLFKDEKVIDASDGVMQPTVQDGERVHKGARIGVLLSGDTDESALHEYLRIQDRINNLASIRAVDEFEETVRTDEQMSALALRIATAADMGNMTELAGLKDELLLLKDEKSAVLGKKEELNAVLKNRQDALQGSIGSSVKEIFSPVAGTVFLQADGLESAMHLKATEGLTPSGLANMTAVETGKSCKIMEGTEWRGAIVADADKAGELKEGQAVTVRFNDFGGVTTRVTIISISAPENDSCVVTFSSNRFFEGLLLRRKTNVDVVIERFEGLRISSKALCQENGQTGVWVKTVTSTRFKPVEIIYGNDTTVIVKEEGSDSGSLRLYDTVVY